MTTRPARRRNGQKRLIRTETVLIMRKSHGLREATLTTRTVLKGVKS